MDKMTVDLVKGFPADQRDTAAELFWQAFGAKLGKVMRPEAKAHTFLTNVIDPNFVISAVRSDGVLMGIAGFKTEAGSFVGGELGDLQSVYGWWGGLWRGVLLSLLERELVEGVLLMDGIVVSDAARGQGIGAIPGRARFMNVWGSSRADSPSLVCCAIFLASDPPRK